MLVAALGGMALLRADWKPRGAVAPDAEDRWEAEVLTPEAQA